MTKVSLRVNKGHHAGTIVAVHKSRFLIGRHRKCHLQVTSPKISVHHTAILLRPDGVWVHDLGSTNGTYVNGVKISDDHPLKHVDQLRMGPLCVEVQIESVQTDDPSSVHEKQFSETEAAKLLLKNPAAEMFVGLHDSDYDSTVLNFPLEAPD